MLQEGCDRDPLSHFLFLIVCYTGEKNSNPYTFLEKFSNFLLHKPSRNSLSNMRPKNLPAFELLHGSCSTLTDALFDGYHLNSSSLSLAQYLEVKLQGKQRYLSFSDFDCKERLILDWETSSTLYHPCYSH